jgi:hypothetical protein
LIGFSVCRADHRDDYSFRRTLSDMLSPGQRAQIKAEIARLEEFRKQCNDVGIQKVIDGWIEQLKKELAEGTAKGS